MDVALGAIVEAIAWTDTFGIVEWCNASFESLVGMPHSAILRKRLTEVLPLSRNGEPIVRHAHPVERSMRDEPVETETYDFIKDDLRRILEVSIRAVCLMSHEKS